MGVLLSGHRLLLTESHNISAMKSVQERIEILKGDITAQKVDAIVNAANSSLLGGGGVDGAIHKAAGPLLYEECRGLNGCATGEAKLTKGYQLPAACVIHTVGPIWKTGARGEEEKLAKCYRSCFELVVKHGLKTVAFPAISTGAYGFPLDRATRVALTETLRFLQHDTSVAKVLFVCFNDKAQQCYQATLKELLNPLNVPGWQQSAGKK
jgi:O-acetyl-ADP-ribose deacetylase (regulator of RNase III)